VRLHIENHVSIGFNISACGDPAMTRNNLGIRSRNLQQQFDGLQRPLERTAIGCIDERISLCTVKLTGHNYIGLLKANHRVAIGMGRWKRNDLDHLRVEMNLARRAHTIGHGW
jgi:hypothetical protein